mmetsp:Transcript_17156/g.30485  ORF Transcript_17156/g.30485 Transcript_17156/m.30485 type:complete len:276 (+) Transcript_17156:627-1454(+)
MVDVALLHGPRQLQSCVRQHGGHLLRALRSVSPSSRSRSSSSTHRSLMAVEVHGRGPHLLHKAEVVADALVHVDVDWGPTSLGSANLQVRTRAKESLHEASRGICQRSLWWEALRHFSGGVAGEEDLSQHKPQVRPEPSGVALLPGLQGGRHLPGDLGTVGHQVLGEVLQALCVLGGLLHGHLAVTFQAGGHDLVAEARNVLYLLDELHHCSSAAQEHHGIHAAASVAPHCRHFGSECLHPSALAREEVEARTCGRGRGRHHDWLRQRCGRRRWG